MALLLALARNIPQAHASLTAGQLGALEVRRRRALREDARRRSASAASASSSPSARAASACAWSPSTRTWPPSATASSASRRPRPPTSSTRRPTSSRSTCPRPPRRRAGSTPRRSRRCATACASSTSPAASWSIDDALQAALDSGKVGGAALDVFPERADHRAPAVRLPQRGRHAAPGRVDRRGHRTAPAYQTAEQVVAALDRRRRHQRGQHPARSAPRTWRRSGRSCRCARKLGRLAMALGEGSSVDRIEAEFRGRIADCDTRLLTLAVLNGVLAGHTEEHVNWSTPRARRGARHRRRPRPSEPGRARLHRARSA